MEAAVKDFLEEEYVAAKDVLEAIKANKAAWDNFQTFSPEYKRIRLAYIEGARKRPDEFKKRLNNFVKMTEKNKQFGFGGIKNILLIWWGRGRDLNSGERLHRPLCCQATPPRPLFVVFARRVIVVWFVLIFVFGTF